MRTLTDRTFFLGLKGKLISGFAAIIDEGTELAEQTGLVVKDLSAMINESQIAAQQIQASVLQENVGIEQITTGMNEINQVTASFLESIKQSNESIENLRGIANGLRTYVDTYKF